MRWADTRRPIASVAGVFGAVVTVVTQDLKHRTLPIRLRTVFAPLSYHGKEKTGHNANTVRFVTVEMGIYLT